ncbi:MAG: DUF1801 domain-containing protein [Aquabacterium sp.]
MTTKARHTSPADTSDAVETLLKSLDHPMKAEIQMLRRAILAADPGVKEGVKWNAPSFRTGEYFATTNLREKDGFSVILHLGAKVRAMAPGSLKVDDPEGMLKWLGSDRAIVRFASAADFKAREAAFAALIREWVRHV